MKIGVKKRLDKRGKRIRTILTIFILMITILFVIQGTSGGESISWGAEPQMEETGPSFIDLPVTDWAYESVANMSQRGIVNGYPDKTFRPGKMVTVGEFIKMAAVICDGKDPGNAPGERWAMNYYKKLLEKGFYTSFDMPEVKINWMIDRGEMALIISGLLEKEKIENFDLVEKSIRDVNASTKYELEIVRAYEAKILTGYPDGTFKPEEKLSRAEAAAALYRLIELNAETDIFSFITNMADYQGDTWLETGDYRLVTPEEFNMKLRVPWNGRLAGFDHTMIGRIYLVKDYKIIEFCNSIPGETFITTASHFNLETFDYILCVPSKHGTQTQMLVMPNPFKKQV